MDGSGARLINLAFRVASVAEIEDGVGRTSGWARQAMHEIDGERFLEAAFGGVRINFFQSALYDGTDQPAAPGFLHASFAVPDLEAMLSDPGWRPKLVWGPRVIHGGFGRRRIAFFEPFPGCRIELMEEIHDRD